ncbi:MAG TPA: GatB/YqeY domain-containing protein [Gammaproteobacteria bacterium]|nr:GatB/YqeY domain-containing protein [Gammaproteobacteria bacterium]
MSLKERLEDDMRAALRAGDKGKLSILRFALAAVKQREVDTRQPLDDAGVQGVLERMIKQGRDALSQYRAGQRGDLAAKEEAEIETLEAYLPEPLGSRELDELISEVIDTLGAAGPQDMGKVMNAIKAQVAGRADMREVSTRVRAALAEE